MYVPPAFTVSLDLPARERWIGAVDLVLTHHTFGESFGAVFAEHNNTLFSDLTPDHYNELANSMRKYYPEQSDELEGISQSFRTAGYIVTFEYLSAWVYFHELAHTELADPTFSRECTGIVTQDRYGNLVHGRNMDQVPQAARNITLHLTFEKYQAVQFEAVDWYWFTTGVVTAVKRNLVSVQENWRFVASPLSSVDVLSKISSGTVPQVFVFRTLLLSTMDASGPLRNASNPGQSFTDAIDFLKAIPLAAPYYVIVAGKRSPDAAIITRSAEAVDDITWLDSASDWLLVQTNYDRNQPDPASDDRRTVAECLLRQLGQVKGATNLGVYAVISSFPVHNVNTAYTAIMSAGTGELHGFVRQPMVPAGPMTNAGCEPAEYSNETGLGRGISFGRRV
ncbi:hypothetical protein CYMTET_4115 [Cymbomonas tetramitiformis]|uniref:ceramidase n=1 Tax=Cymbomonas tetramitiformis TaxID=36881 RepID=A0AAE0H293_9CHLO|nr:hypothetical protein CYMTET_4115 [Cymbomonas tetramitiformis]